MYNFLHLSPGFLIDLKLFSPVWMDLPSLHDPLQAYDRILWRLRHPNLVLFGWHSDFVLVSQFRTLGQFERPGTVGSDRGLRPVARASAFWSVYGYSTSKGELSEALCKVSR
ncbi:hypothetical protein PoB_001246100 [Plakobranchus ocellatus]|uniref:Protein kinase domain-containing protein n=1 Tax=Plakobranchus ocellatus TaxID=259542 RepID=A0AAV3YF69_9GAST|nr:hypothetical protein PoB_001246100 [Plakobranchus ocellatus]